MGDGWKRAIAAAKATQKPDTAGTTPSAEEQVRDERQHVARLVYEAECAHRGALAWPEYPKEPSIYHRLADSVCEYMATHTRKARRLALEEVAVEMEERGCNLQKVTVNHVHVHRNHTKATDDDFCGFDLAVAIRARAQASAGAKEPKKDSHV